MAGAPNAAGEKAPPRARAAEATARIPALPAGVFAFERFVDGLAFAGAGERNRLKLAGSEIFDNIMHHATPLEDGTVIVRAARRGGSLFLAFHFKSRTFAAYAASCADEGADAEGPTFDRERRRWRGIGLRMCRNLALSVRFRSGGRLDRIYLRFPPSD